MDRIKLTDDEADRLVALRDTAVALAQMVEDRIGMLFQVHHIAPSGERELAAQFPLLGGELTVVSKQGFTEVVGKHCLTEEQAEAGWKIEVMTQDAPQFMFAAKPAEPAAAG